MKSTIFAFITLFSCAYVWRPVTAQFGPDCDLGSCYDGLEESILEFFQMNVERFCTLVESTAEACLDGLNLTESCFNRRDWAKAEYPYLCSLPREDVGASIQCVYELSSGNGTCNDEIENVPNLPSGFCAYYTAILDCYRSAMMGRCPDHVGPALHFLTTQFDYTSRNPGRPDCPVFNQLDTGGAGSLALPPTFYWIETAMIALYITWLYAK